MIRRFWAGRGPSNLLTTTCCPTNERNHSHSRLKRMVQERLAVIVALGLLYVFLTTRTTQSVLEQLVVSPALPSLCDTKKSILQTNTQADDTSSYGGLISDSSPLYLCSLLDQLKHRSDATFHACMTALEQAQTQLRTTLSNEPCNEPTLFFHSYWDGPFADTAKLSLLSSLYAHPPGCAHLTIYTENMDYQHTIRDMLQPFLHPRHYTVQVFDSVQLFKDIQQVAGPALHTKIQQKTDYIQNLAKRPPGFSRTRYSNLIRVVVLAARGGIYLDSDVLVINSFVPLQGQEFYYRWSTQEFCNTAVFSLIPGSRAAQILVDKVLDATDVQDASVKMRPFNLYPHVRGHIPMLPSAYFDPSWVIHDLQMKESMQYAARHYRLEDFGAPFFAAQSTEFNVSQFFPGALAYHWHNGFSNGFGNNSVAHTFLDSFERRRDVYLEA